MNLQRIAAAVPSELTGPLRNTPVERAFVQLRRWQQQRCSISIDTPEGEIKMVVWDDWRFIEHIQNGGMYEPQTYDVLVDAIQKFENPVIADVGARWGVMTLYALQQGVPGGRITAFEPDEHHLKLLRQNLQGTEVRIKSTAVGVGPEDYRLADLSPVPDIIVIDVDGAEWSVLQSLSGISTQPTLLVEVHPQLLGPGPGVDDVTDATILRYLYSNGYNVTIRKHRESGGEEITYPLPAVDEYLVVATPPSAP